MKYKIIKTENYLLVVDDSEIKEGDWFYVKTPNIYGGNVVARCLSFGKHCWSENILTATTDEKGYHASHCVKIIMTKDQDLIKDGVQPIDDEFLQWFVQNPCEKVEVQKWSSLAECGYSYHIIIPKEEPKGAKWQQEQDKNKYSEEDMIKFALFLEIHLPMKPIKTHHQLLEQFKKK